MAASYDFLSKNVCVQLLILHILKIQTSLTAKILLYMARGGFVWFTNGSVEGGCVGGEGILILLLRVWLKAPLKILLSRLLRLEIYPRLCLGYFLFDWLRFCRGFFIIYLFCSVSWDGFFFCVFFCRFFFLPFFCRFFFCRFFLFSLLA